MNGKEDAAYQEAIKQWEDKGYRVTAILDPPDLTWVDQWVAWNLAVLEGVKKIFGNRDLWGYWGMLIIRSIGDQNLQVWQVAEIDEIKKLLAKDPMSMTDLGDMQGRLIHLITPDLRQRLPSGLVTILDVIGRIGGVS